MTTIENLLTTKETEELKSIFKNLNLEEKKENKNKKIVIKIPKKMIFSKNRENLKNELFKLIDEILHSTVDNKITFYETSDNKIKYLNIFY